MSITNPRTHETVTIYQQQNLQRSKIFSKCHDFSLDLITLIDNGFIRSKKIHETL